MADKSFDRNQWHPVLCKTPAEADLQIADWGLKDKKIKRLNTIGTVRYRESLRLANSGDSFLTATASPDQLIWEGLVFAPCEVEVCEPVVIVFEDDRTLALLPHHTHGLWLAPDQIAPDVVNGTNWSNLFSLKMCRERNSESLSLSRGRQSTRNTAMDIPTKSIGSHWNIAEVSI